MYSSKPAKQSRTPMMVQLLVIMVAATLLVSFLAGEATRYFEKKYRVEQLLDQSNRVVSLFSASALEAVISEDTPVLLSIIQASIEEEPDIEAIQIENEKGVPLASRSRNGTEDPHEIVTYVEEVRFENDLYGRIVVDWNTARLYREVEHHVLRVRTWLSTALLLLTILVTLAVYKVTVQPLSRIHRRLSSLSAGNLETELKVDGAREIFALSESVNALCKAMRDNKSHNEELEWAKQALFEAKERAEITLHSIGDAVITTDASGCVEYMNPIAEELSGWRLQDAKGRLLSTVVRVVCEDTREPVASLAKTALETGEVCKLDTHNILIDCNGREYAIEESAAPIRAHDGDFMGAVVVFRNVTKSRTLTKEIEHQAAHDALTGLVNRTEFERLLKQALEDASRNGARSALLYFDLDQFKVVNDTCGHAAGDNLLQQLASILAGKLRKKDVIGRLGGDEFGVILTDCEANDAVRVAEKLRKATGEFRFLWEEKSFGIGISVGALDITKDFPDTDSLLQAADEACYAAKDAGRNRVHLFSPNDDALQKRRGEMQWVSRLHAALDQDRFKVFAQTILGIGPDASPGLHYEILVRMEDEKGQLVPPGAFVPAAERYGVMPAIDKWVVRAVTSWLSTQPSHLDALSFCSINLSAATFTDADFLRFIEDQIKATGVPPEKLCFEITETAVMANFNQAQALISSLKEKNCLFALDDFGSGMSSFGYLKNLPVDFLKIEGSFVREIMTDDTSYALVRSINDIGHVMGKKTIAEFVEDDAVLGMVTQLGVDYAQGYGISKPMPLIEFVAETSYRERESGTG